MTGPTTASPTRRMATIGAIGVVIVVVVVVTLATLDPESGVTMDISPAAMGNAEFGTYDRDCPGVDAPYPLDPLDP